MKYRMRMLNSHFEYMRGLLVSDTSVEQGCFALCSSAKLADECILLVKRVLAIAEDDLLIQQPDFLSVKPEAMLKVARIAQKLNLSVCMIHTHPLVEGAVEFSIADNLGNTRTFNFFNRMVPGGLNSCLVWNGDMSWVDGRVYSTAAEWTSLYRVEIISTPGAVSTHHAAYQSGSDQLPDFDRQVLLIGKQGQEMLQHIRLVIAGIGGIGSYVAGGFAQSGFGAVDLVDNDRVDRTNRARVLGTTPQDVNNRMPKVDVVSRHIKSTSPECDLQTFQNVIEDPDIRERLISADVIVCATDNTRSRAFLNQLCQQYYVPLLDLGVQFVADPVTGDIVNEVGKVNLVIPGTACLVCSGHIDPDRLRLEAMTSEERKRLADQGYVRGIDEPEPSMLPYNLEVVARGIQVLVGHFSRLSTVGHEVYERFSFLNTSGKPHHKPVRKRQDINCMFCAPHSDYLGEGDAKPFLITCSCISGDLNTGAA